MQPPECSGPLGKRGEKGKKETDLFSGFGMLSAEISEIWAWFNSAALEVARSMIFPTARRGGRGNDWQPGTGCPSPSLWPPPAAAGRAVTVPASAGRRRLGTSADGGRYDRTPCESAPHRPRAGGGESPNRNRSGFQSPSRRGMPGGDVAAPMECYPNLNHALISAPPPLLASPLSAARQNGFPSEPSPRTRR